MNFVVKNLNTTKDIWKKLDEAVTLYKEALEITKKAHGDQPTERRARALNNLASVYNEQKKHEQAEPLLRECVDIVKKVHGDEHPHMAFALCGLALTLHKQDPGNYSSESMQLGKQALAIAEKTLGPDHHATQLYSIYWGDGEDSEDSEQDEE